MQASAVMLSADAAGDFSAERVGLLWLCLCVFLCPALHFRLYRFKGFHRNNRLMGFGGMELRQFPVIFQRFLGQMVFTELGLQKQIPSVSIVPQDAFHGAFVKHMTALGGIAAFVQPLHNSGDSIPGKVVGKNAFYDFRLFGNNREPTIPVPIAKHEIPPRLAVLEISANAPFLVFADRKAFFLCKACEDGQHTMSLQRDESTNALVLLPEVTSVIEAAYYALSRFVAVNSGALDDWGGKTSIAFCAACGNAFIKRGNRQKYCLSTQCQSIRNQRKSKEYYYRERQKEIDEMLS